MRIIKLTAAAVLLVVVSSFAQKTFYVTPKEDNVGIYQNQVRQMNERAIETVGKANTLRVIDTKGDSYKVKTDSGKEGWIEKRLATVNDAKKAYTFDDVEVQGYLDNPTPIYITDMDDGGITAIELDRSFADALKRGADKERVNRTIK